MPARQVVEHVLTKFGLGDRPHAIETNSWEAILEAVGTTDLFSLAPRDEAMRHGWTSRLVAISIPELDIRPRTGVLMRADAYLSPLAARAIELIEQGFAEHARDKRRARRVSASPPCADGWRAQPPAHDGIRSTRPGSGRVARWSRGSSTTWRRTGTR